MKSAPVDPAKVCEAYSAGKSIQRTGLALGINAGRVRKILLAEGVTLRSTGGIGAAKAIQPRRDFDLERATGMRVEGASLREIATALHCGTTMVCERLREAGIKPPPRPKPAPKAKPRKTLTKVIAFQLEETRKAREAARAEREARKLTGEAIRKAIIESFAAGITGPKVIAESTGFAVGSVRNHLFNLRSESILPAFKPQRNAPDPKRKLWKPPEGMTPVAWPERHLYGSAWARSLPLRTLHDRIRLMERSGVSRREIRRISGLTFPQVKRLARTQAAV